MGENFKKLSKVALALAMALPTVGNGVQIISAKDTAPVVTNEKAAELPPVKDGYTYVSAVSSVDQNNNEITLTMQQGERIRFTFLENNVFRMYMAAPGEEFQEYPTPNSQDHTATITNKTDDSYYTEYQVKPTLTEDDTTVTMMTDQITITVDKETSMMTVTSGDQVIVKETAPLQYKAGSTIQTLASSEDEYYYGGGTQNGRFSHKGEKIKITNSNNWVDGGVASPNPFYWSTAGYGVVRNTWKPGEYDFTSNDSITTTHNEQRFDAYFFIDPTPVEILGDYYELTGNPAELPEYASYLGHLNCYNRDYWKEVDEGTSRAIKLGDKWYVESQSDNGGEKETLLGDNDISAQNIIREYQKYDMPLGWFLPNDGYGCGYGQSETQAGDLDNLKAFADYAIGEGVQTGLWTQSNLWPADPSNPQKGERDIYKEVENGVHSVKTDVAWVGAGYSMALNGISVAYDAIVSKSGLKPNIVTLDGWAGTQRYGGIWTGDQSGGAWEYIRFHIPTYIGTSLSGQPNVGSDMDGIFGGKNPIVWTRDFQWKAFTTYMLDMDGWGSNQKSPWALGEDGTSINRAYLKLKAQLMPYNNTISHEATAEGGLPMIRAMFLEEANEFTLGNATQYQYMWGDSFLVAPIYQNTAADGAGNDIRNDIYLPSTSDVWIDYFTGEQYRGGQILNNFDAPIWKLPVFVKNGSIVPMYPENNNPEAVSETNEQGLDRTQRIVEFWPAGSTEFEAYEDDGKTQGGAGTTTLYTSVVEDGTATLTANKTIGTYTGMQHERSTEFIVNVSKEPTAVTGSVGGKDVTFTKVDSMEALESADGNVYFYDANPDVYVKQFADEGSSIADLEVTSTPKLYVKSAEKLNINEYDFQVVVEGFANDQDLGSDTLNEDLAVPQNVQELDKSDDFITIGWDTVEEAVSYDVMVDGNVYRNILEPTYTQSGLHFSTEHTYQVRTVNAAGEYSNWSEAVTYVTDDDPFRNTPTPTEIDWEGTIYSNRTADLAFDHEFQSGDGGFHSGGGDIGKALTVDYGKAYQLDMIEYYPRTDAGNGTVTKMEISTSIDGIHWSEPQTYDFNRDATTKTVDMKGTTARYVRFIPRASVGGFFSASEILVYKVDKTDGKLVGDVNNSGTIDENDLTFYENYIGLNTTDKDFEYIKNVGGDIDGNDEIDAYDLSYVAAMLNDGISDPAEGVEGKITLVPSKTDIKAGDLVTVDIYGIGLKNVNAFSVAFPEDVSLYNVENPGSASISTAFMKNFSKNRTHSAGARDTWTVFTNVGAQDLINGTGTIATLTIKANADFTWDESRNATKAILVGQDMSTTDAIIDLTQKPEVSETHKVLTPGEGISEITFTNEHLTNDDGSALWQQSNWKEIMFDGQTSGSMAEFMWYYGTDNIGPEVMLPTDFNITLDGAHQLTNVTIYGRDTAGNGSVKTSKLVAYNGDEIVYESGEVSGYTPVFEVNATVTKLVWTPLTATGNATGTTTGTEENRMLSLYEIVIEEDSAVEATGISFDDSSVKTLKVGSMGEVSATVAPGNATNPFYNVTSSKPDVVSVTKIPMESKYVFLVKGLAEGTATLTATSEDGEFTATWEVAVETGLNDEALNEELDAVNGLYQNLYTVESWAKLQNAVDQAKAILEDPEATQNDLDTAVIAIKTARVDLEFKGSNVDQPSSENLISHEGMTYVDESSCSAAEQEHASNVLDDNPDTIWHSNYNTGYKLPQYFTIDLGAEYALEQVDYLPRQGSRNGHVTHYRVEVSTDNETFTPVVEGYFENDGNELTDPTVAKEIKFDTVNARYVKFIAIESLGDTPNAYASCAEMNFYGLAVGESGNFEDLQAAIAEAEKLSADAYTADSWAAFEAALTAAKEVTEDSEAAVINNALATLTATKEALVARASEGTLNSLKAQVAKAEELRDKYAEEDFAEVDAAIQAANALISEPENAGTVAVAEAMVNLSKAMQGLQNAMDIDDWKAYIQYTIDYGKEELANAENVRPVQLKKLEEAIAAAEAVVADPEATVEEVKAADVAITKAVQELYEIVNKDELKAVIAEAKKITADGYTAESFQALADAIAAGEKVAANDDATTTEVSNAITAITDAIAGLEKTDIVDKSALEYEIGLAEIIVANIDDYRPSTVEGLADKLAAAKAVFEDATATQEAVDEAAAALREARLAARVKADLTALKEAIAKAEAIDLSEYTASSAQAVKNALDNAKPLLNDPEVDQKTVDDAAKALNKAVASLVVDDGNTGGNQGGDEGNSGSQNGNGSGTTDNSGNGSATDSGNTAAENTTAGFGMMALVAGGAALVLLKKKSSKQENR